VSEKEVKTWLLGYDIGQPRRLGRVYRRVKKKALRLQYSVYTLELGSSNLLQFLDELGELIDEQVDDIRVYHLPDSCKVWKLGRGGIHDGVYLDAKSVTKLFERPSDGEPEHDDGIKFIP
jgi:CRISPR-associated protein Cas2